MWQLSCVSLNSSLVSGEAVTSLIKLCAVKGSQYTVVVRFKYVMLLDKSERGPAKERQMYKCSSLSIRFKLKTTVNSL